MFDSSAKAHVIMALNQFSVEEDLTIFEQNGHRVLREFTGMYKGYTENSYLIGCYDLIDYLRLVELGKEYGQESILYLSRESIRQPMKASLIMLNDNQAQPEKIGIFKCVGMFTPNKDAWTLDKELHEYYTIE